MLGSPSWPQKLLTEIRLIFALVEDLNSLYGVCPFIAEKRRVYEGPKAGEFAANADLVEDARHV